MAGTEGEFYFNIATGQVEEGKVSGWRQLMGPYPTRDAAIGALRGAAERTQAWDEDDDAPS